ncbi:hypothetical protein HELRODRAFT_116093 [Helobdella robusta]|uniref:Solute carrier family 12 member 2 n=1 Tax=Helobdella robusta TaxID=6412 RepID=T1EGC9_HELRO|nr:hypothetical protein HELRODRAFT_116093 [Helobdella robusta]ESN92099.1 hypothetical protein HELRODRAFT_116093 [Helobdella robusta]
MNERVIFSFNRNLFNFSNDSIICPQIFILYAFVFQVDLLQIKKHEHEYHVTRDVNHTHTNNNTNTTTPTTATEQPSNQPTYLQQTQKTFGNNTLETLPHIDHYRNLLSTTGVMRSRPTLLELHDLEAAVSFILSSILCHFLDHNGFDLQKSPSHIETQPSATAAASKKFGWIQGVLVRCVLNIFGVMLFLRLTWVVGQAGIGLATVIILLASLVTTITTLSMSAISTNGVVKGGGAYYMISRSLGPEYGGAIGIVFSLANAVAVAMYIVGFAETIRDILEEHDCLMVDRINDVRIMGIITAFAMLLITLAGMGWEAKAQLILLVLLLVAILNFFIGTFIPPSEEQKERGFTGYSLTNFMNNFPPDFRGEHFFTTFAIYFPAATGILAGANISGDLKDAQKAIPKGTLLAILLTTMTYLAVAWMSGCTIVREKMGPIIPATLLSGAGANQSITPPIFNNSFNDSSNYCRENPCPYGLLNDMRAIQISSAFGPITVAGIVSATLSSALASLVSAPKVFQAVCKDKIFPGIEVFGRPYGKSGEPRLAYMLAFALALACICIGDLNAIAPLISNFFLMSYALVNYSCFDASLAKSPGWRPSFKYYSMWLSLMGAILCVGVMFVMNWWTALITIAIVAALFVYVHYRKPDINWGSSTQAHVYKDALQNTQKLVQVDEHVKNYRPQILALTGLPQDRVPLVDFCSSITKNIGLMIAGHVVLTPVQYKLMDLRQSVQKAHLWLNKQKIKSFYSVVAADNLRRGVQAMLQAIGLGKLRPNVMLLGFKSNWNDCSPEEVQDYFNIINDAFDLHYGVGILRLQSGLDFSNLHKKEGTTNSDSFSKLATPTTATVGGLGGDDDDDDEFDFHERKNREESPNKNEKLGLMGINNNNSNNNNNNDDDGCENCDATGGVRYFRSKQSRGFIDVWWLFDDGGLTLLIPYLLSTKKLWKNCQLRVYIAGSKATELDREQRQMANLLSKFRIEYSSLVVLPDIGKKPSEQSITDFSKLISKWTINKQLKETEQTHPWKITEAELVAQNAKNYRHLRLKELLKQHSSDSKFIVMTLPIPRRGICSFGLYMAWLDTLTSDLPPFLLLRGNQENVLTFYS